MKKLLSVLLAVTVLLALSSIALAADPVAIYIDSVTNNAGITYNFDSDVEGWVGKDADATYSYNKTTVAHETFDGKGCLKMILEPGNKNFVQYQVQMPLEGADIQAGQTFVFKVYIPENVNVKTLQPFIQWDNWAEWKDGWTETFVKGQWNDVEFTIPSGFTAPANAFGFQLQLNEGLDAEEEQNPQTGYASVLPFVLLAGASGVVLLKSRKK
ncbi:MAG TPA: hypothetical protein PK830_02520 [Candidatus Atribacteria bacterium]|nr:hypothetical protein [Candidatus Atribacteria bacterium]HPT77967.1 hypothetical protein [Candidatus Atribacteria bacterium]